MKSMRWDIIAYTFAALPLVMTATLWFGPFTGLCSGLLALVPVPKMYYAGWNAWRRQEALGSTGPEASEPQAEGVVESYAD